MKTASARSKGSSERDFKRTLGAQLADLRHARKLTQRTLRERTDLSVEYISRLENGRENPTILTLRNLVQNGLDLRLPEFFKRLN